MLSTSTALHSSPLTLHPLPLLSAPCVLTMCFNTWTVALHFTRKTTALLIRTHIQTRTHTRAQMIKWHQMTGQQGYLTSWNFAEATERLLNPGGPLMKHRGRQRDFPFNLRTMRRSRCLRFIHSLHTSLTRATPGSLLLTKVNTEPYNTDTACRRWVSQHFYERGKSQRPLNLCFSQRVNLAGKYLSF